ncbi:MAG: hypothetical protein ACLFV6_00805, partial [Spirulinaceae cyanobacterium]
MTLLRIVTILAVGAAIAPVEAARSETQAQRVDASEIAIRETQTPWQTAGTVAVEAEIVARDRPPDEPKTVTPETLATTP